MTNQNSTQQLYSLPATFMRGGTSKGVMILEKDLPENRDEWGPILLGIMGSPDPNSRQLDGMGGGISSLSKVCVIGPSPDDDADVNYTFVQVAVQQASINLGANCGNMSSAVGPFALEQGFVTAPTDSNEITVRIRNTNTNKIIHSTFPVANGQLDPNGAEEISGVPGSAAPILLAFQNPGGARTGKLLPSGNPKDTITLNNGRQVDISMVDAANPCVFVPAEALGIDGHDLPENYDADSALMATFEEIRQQASVLMGITKNIEEAKANQTVPFIAMASTPKDTTTIGGETIAGDSVDITIRMLSMGNVHRAIPVTGSLCTAAGQIVSGTILNDIVSKTRVPGRLTIGHPSGIINVSATTSPTDDQSVQEASVFRTSRKLFKGEVYYRG